MNGFQALSKKVSEGDKELSKKPTIEEKIKKIINDFRKKIDDGLKYLNFFNLSNDGLGSPDSGIDSYLELNRIPENNYDIQKKELLSKLELFQKFFPNNKMFLYLRKYIEDFNTPKLNLIEISKIINLIFKIKDNSSLIINIIPQNNLDNYFILSIEIDGCIYLYIVNNKGFEPIKINN